MPWWSWVLIWTVLVLGLVGMLAYFGWSLFRKVMAAAREAGALLEKTAILSERSDDMRYTEFHSAIFDDPDELRARREQDVADRRVARQARRDKRVRRAKILVKADALRFSDLGKRT
ncbi:hypothetical protein [uncultured Leifsonia sp.]|uniref:hypothetical protein n=1 Tax=uncultured Leifsonia sp. TaxID=340359 RepID=UPI0025FF6ABA|nr:hypothetical protein [uncultured Leifsonia sp.]